MKKHKVGNERYDAEEIMGAILEATNAIASSLKFLVWAKTGKTIEQIERELGAKKE